MIRIKSRRHNFRRCGMAHPKESTEYPDDRFTKKDLKILTAEPMLTVEVVEPEDKASATKTADKKDEKALSTGSGPDGKAETKDKESDIVKAAKRAVKEGNTTADGKPTVEALGEILGRNITAAERDEAWEKLTAES